MAAGVFQGKDFWVFFRFFFVGINGQRAKNIICHQQKVVLHEQKFVIAEQVFASGRL